MIPITDYAMDTLCEKLGIFKEGLTYLAGGREDSDGTIYTYDEKGKKKVLKILAIPAAEVEKIHNLDVRIQYAHYLAENGIRLAHPLVNRNDRLYETVLDHQYLFAAYSMDFYNGESPASNELTDQLVTSWGKLTGKSHAITKSFPLHADTKSFHYKSEIDFFMDWCKEPEIKKAWADMKQYLHSKNTDTDSFGFIHNDNHQRNILAVGNCLTLIDFDCAGLQFFMQDITTPAQGLMFDITGGMCSECKDPDKLKHFFDTFISAYESKNHLDDSWYKEIGTFLNYRRMLLFTCMQDWLQRKPDLKKGFMENILNPKPFYL
ncbi:MAG: hypothetical protein E7256_18165 [Lachnospiraceae bacterium]|nr:hypothetical protein [Lachnospiraceae bacterium]